MTDMKASWCAVWGTGCVTGGWGNKRNVVHTAEIAAIVLR
jgi:hypothetical protein